MPLRGVHRFSSQNPFQYPIPLPVTSGCCSDPPTSRRLFPQNIFCASPTKIHHLPPFYEIYQIFTPLNFAPPNSSKLKTGLKTPPPVNSYPPIATTPINSAPVPPVRIPRHPLPPGPLSVPPSSRPTARGIPRGGGGLAGGLYEGDPRGLCQINRIQRL